MLVVTDHFTKFAMAIPARNKTTKTRAEAFYNNFIGHNGISTRLHSDQVANFESDMIKELCVLTNMKKSLTLYTTLKSIQAKRGSTGDEQIC